MSVPVSQQVGATLAVARTRYKAIFLNDSFGQLLAILEHVSSLFKSVRLMDTLVVSNGVSKVKIIGSSSLVSWAKRESQEICSNWSFYKI